MRVHDAAMDKTLDDLLGELGTELAKTEFGLGFRDPIDRAREWMRENRDALIQTICTNRGLLDTAEAEAITAVADLVAIAIHGAPANTVLRVVTRVGLDRYCSEPDPFRE